MPIADPQTITRGTRVALVIGNSAYKHVPPLDNPVIDAEAMAAALERLGFDPVTRYSNLDKSGHDQAFKEFAARTENTEMAVIYYAGHGMQDDDGENYLVPVSAELTHVGGLALEATRLSDVMRVVEGAQQFRFVILDACRDNPFRRKMQVLEPTRSMLACGLAAPPERNGNSTLIAYAARAGTRAKDGAKGANSPFATALLRHIETPNKDIRLIIGLVRDDVCAATSNQQEPFFYGSLGGKEIQ